VSQVSRASGVSGVSGVVFDLDGVLIDSEGLWDEVRRGLAADAGRPWPPEATRSMMGMSTPEWSAYLSTTVGIPGSASELAHQVIELMVAQYADELPLLPDAVASVRRLADRWPLALASSSPRRLIDAVLADAGIADAFEVTVSTEEVAAGKPDPAVYVAAVSQLGVPACATVAVEDSTNGLRAAAAAGLVVLAVPRPDFPPAADALALAAARLASLTELTVPVVTAAAGAAAGQL
jgi:HAD superfamily hydrolase (TIGR01509 family)